MLQSLVNTNVVTHHVALKVLTQEQHLSHLADAFVLDPEMQLLKALIEQKPGGLSTSGTGGNPSCDMDKLSKAILCLFRPVPLELQLRLVMEAIDYEVDCMDRLDKPFRTNSLSIKIVSNFLHVQGREFLYRILSKPMKDMWNLNVSCEVEPHRMKVDPGELETVQKDNSNRLFRIAEQFLVAVLKSSRSMPEWFRTLCRHLKWKMQVQLFPFDFEEEKMHCSSPPPHSPLMPKAKLVGSSPAAIGTLFFLRFICPAIVSPEQHGLCASKLAGSGHSWAFVIRLISF